MGRLRLLALLVLVLLAAPLARAGESINFDNPANAAHPTILHLGSIGANSSSIVFSSPTTKQAVFSLLVSLCSTCNISFQLVAKDPTGNGADAIVCADSAAITALGTFIYTVGTGTDITNMPTTPSSGTLPYGVRLNCNRPLPPQWYVRLVIPSGTADLSMRGFGWNY